VAQSEDSTAMNSAVILPENGSSLWPATATASTGTEYSVGTGGASTRPDTTLADSNSLRMAGVWMVQLSFASITNRCSSRIA
jgi:hypothetical protein